MPAVISRHVSKLSSHCLWQFFNFWVSLGESILRTWLRHLIYSLTFFLLNHVFVMHCIHGLWVTIDTHYKTQSGWFSFPPDCPRQENNKAVVWKIGERGSTPLCGRRLSRLPLSPDLGPTNLLSSGYRDPLHAGKPSGTFLCSSAQLFVDQEHWSLPPREV